MARTWVTTLVLLALMAMNRETAIAQSIPFGFFKSPCPTGYVYVSALPPYTQRDFCVMKYEAKNVGGVARSQAAGAPWVNIVRGFGEETVSGARKACRDLGHRYDLISNSEWQTIARQVAATGWNWNTGTSYSGQMSHGHSDGSPNSPLAADVNDALACSGTGQTCSDTVWHAQRRTSRLPNGATLWDVNGNVEEWVRDNNFESIGLSDYASFFTSGIRQMLYGHTSLCPSPSTAPYCGFGYAEIDQSSGAIRRSGMYTDNDMAGVFAANLMDDYETAGAFVGFRCVYYPHVSSDPCDARPAPPPGTACSGGALFAGIANGARYMTTPGGCTDSPTPTCSSTDSLMKAWASATGNHSGAIYPADGAWNSVYLQTIPAAIASKYCMNMTYGGYTDWFLPATNELQHLYIQSAAIGGFTAGNYWASVHSANANAIVVSFSSGTPTAFSKLSNALVRCVRRY